MHDVEIGQGATDASGQFVIPVSPCLQTGNKIYAVDVCAPPGMQMGPVALVPPFLDAPMMSREMLLLLIATLGLIGLLSLSRLRRPN